MNPETGKPRPAKAPCWTRLLALARSIVITLLAGPPELILRHYLKHGLPKTLSDPARKRKTQINAYQATLS